MGLRDTILSIKGSWDEYRDEAITSKAHEIYDLVVNQFPAQLISILPKDAALDLKGSTGAGNVTAAPWIATFDPSVTTKASQGFYVVYLFSVDLQRLFVSLAFGTTQFKYFKVAERHIKLRESARHLQGLLNGPRSTFLDALDLAPRKKDRLHVDYEQSNIAAIEYDLNDLPEDDVLAADYLYLIGLYQQLASHPLLPDLQQLFEAAIEPVEMSGLEVIDFVPRQPKTKAKRGGGAANRRSQVSKKVGDRGERIVFEYELAEARKAGRGVSEVDWLAKRGLTPGWDITSIDRSGKKLFIEVKSSVGPDVSGLIMTANEWAAAREHGESYCIYLVTSVMKATPKIQIIRNPAKLVLDGYLDVVEAAWALGLHPVSEAAEASMEDDLEDAELVA